jgi:hypothetical protein
MRAISPGNETPVKRELKSKKLILNRETLKSLAGGWQTHPIQSPLTEELSRCVCGTDTVGCGGGGGPGFPSIGGPSGCVACLTN